jgi:hypothetical protein
MHIGPNLPGIGVLHGMVGAGDGSSVESPRPFLVSNAECTRYDIISSFFDITVNILAMLSHGSIK